MELIEREESDAVRRIQIELCRRRAPSDRTPRADPHARYDELLRGRDTAVRGHDQGVARGGGHAAVARARPGGAGVRARGADRRWPSGWHRSATPAPSGSSGGSAQVATGLGAPACRGDRGSSRPGSARPSRSCGGGSTGWRPTPRPSGPSSKRGCESSRDGSTRRSHGPRSPFQARLSWQTNSGRVRL